MNKRLILISLTFLVLILLALGGLYLLLNPVPNKISITNLAIKNNDSLAVLKLEAIEEWWSGCSDIPINTKETLSSREVTIKIGSFRKPLEGSFGVNCLALVRPVKEVEIPIAGQKENETILVNIFLKSKKNVFHLEKNNYFLTLKVIESSNVKTEKNLQIVLLPKEINEWYTNHLDANQIGQLEDFAKSKNISLARDIYPEINNFYERGRRDNDRILVVSNPLKEKGRAEYVGTLPDGTQVYSKWPSEREGGI